MRSVSSKIKIAVATSPINRATMQLQHANNVTLTLLMLQ